MTRDEFAQLFKYKDYVELMEQSEVLFDDYDSRWTISQGKDGRWGAWIERFDGEIAEMDEGTFSENLDDESAQLRLQWFTSWDKAFDCFDAIWQKNRS